MNHRSISTIVRTIILFKIKLRLFSGRSFALRIQMSVARIEEVDQLNGENNQQSSRSDNAFTRQRSKLKSRTTVGDVAHLFPFSCPQIDAACGTA